MDLFDNSNEPPLPFRFPDQIGYKLNWSEKLHGYHIAIPNGQLFYSERFFSKKISDRCLEYFQENSNFDWHRAKWKDISDVESIDFRNIRWKQDSINLYGKKLPLPRLTSWYGDQGRDYTYSGITSKPNDWNDGLLYLKREIERCFGLQFNSVLLNWYRDGEDYLNWHSDDEKELGKNPVIASANFGETRDFAVRRKDDKDQKLVIPLKHGTLLVMSGELQHFWEHSVPKRKKVSGSRFNLTFRNIGL
ncbi:alpha-ketoglutarate-dependent dioxygenase AlkB [Oceanimonas baumannii]|uniref:alpha-ketoglutarate-dependent dioxygenase AlkB family protein n=1 Tax=Oceanimonas baumannii TaxID=129578 RepID=UPI001D184482|nr:alpha-ketoglutarate-dependent dioxygenase AlkB [Oceanimonas baumannii]MCC4264709.1 alpha-ketoglutarate-dependent dioxygenase AlkB [Oceanimonas baumannii]